MIDQYGNEISWVPVLEKTNKPKYKQIAEVIERDINNGILVRGLALPPQRILAYHLNVNHGTITRAYKLCEEKGLIKGITGKGTFVSKSAGLQVDLLTDNENNKLISMGMTLPLYEINEQIKNHITDIDYLIDYDIALKYCPPGGHIKHRFIASEWLKQYKIQTDPSNIIITSGTQNALSTILMTLFSRGDKIIVDQSTYTGLISLSNYLGIVLIPVEGSRSGINLEELEKTCNRVKAKAIYLLPDCHNPTTITLSKEKRYDISQIIIKYNLLLIEDATYSFTNLKQIEPISAMIPGHSIYIHGTSKSLSPAFRISYIISPVKYVERLIDGVNNTTWMASPYTAEIISILQESKRLDKIIQSKLELLKERNQLFDEIFIGYDYIEASTSMFRYIELPQDWDDAQIEDLALDAGVQIFSANRFNAGMINAKNPIRISLSSPFDLKELEVGLLILKDVLEGYKPT